MSLRALLAVPAAVLLFASTGEAQAPYPDCGSSTRQPVWGSSGYPEADGGSSDTRLFATHPVTVVAGLPFDPPGTGSPTMDPPPPGLTRVTVDDLMTDGGLGDFRGYTDSVTVLGEEPGTYPFRATWIQTDENGQHPCSAAAGSSITLMPPLAAVRLGKPKDTGGLGGTESTVTLKIPRIGGDLRPLEVRYRAVKKQRFPGASAKGRTLTVPMREGDPGFGANNRRTTVKVGALRAIISPENGEDLLRGFGVLFEINANPSGSPYGYDLDVRQGGRSITRLRVAGKCGRTGGSVSCKRKKVKRTP